MKRLSLLSVAGMGTASEVLDVTRGKTAGDLAVADATILNVYTGELSDHLSVVIKGEWIAYVGDNPENRIGPETEVIEATGKTF